MRKVGDRVGAVLSSDDKQVNILGFGKYVGDEIPDADAGGLGPLCREAGCPNPKIVLDNGDVVWGCECWWGGEEEVRSRLFQARESGLNLVMVSIKKHRDQQEKE